GVEDALTVLEAALLRLDLVRPALNEQLGEHTRWPRLRWHRGTATGPRQAKALARQRQGGVPGLAEEEVGRGLIERDEVLEGGPWLRVRGAGQEAEVGVVARADIRVRQPREDREGLPEVLDDLQIGGECVILAGLLREKRGWMQSQWRVDADHPPWRPGG